jgi:hypothetical protein
MALDFVIYYIPTLNEDYRHQIYRNGTVTMSKNIEPQEAKSNPARLRIQLRTADTPGVHASKPSSFTESERAPDKC